MTIRITRITLNGLNAASLGVTEVDAAGYREWVAGQMAAEYPDAEIEINEADSTRAVQVETDADIDDGLAAQALEDEVNRFAEGRWERCHWAWSPTTPAAP